MLLVCVADWAQRSTPYDVVDTPADKTTVERLLSEAESLAEGSNLTLFFARKFVGLPYVANTLEVADRSASWSIHAVSTAPHSWRR